MDNTQTERYQWIQELIQAEDQILETGLVNFENSLNPERILISETLTFLNHLKLIFEEAVEIFNDSKPTIVGRIKLYPLVKTQSDFMLFRNGYKLIFTFKKPGHILIQFHFMDSQAESDEYIENKWGAFNKVQWFHKEKLVDIEYLAKYFLVQFIRESINT